LLKQKHQGENQTGPSGNSYTAHNLAFRKAMQQQKPWQRLISRNQEGLSTTRRVVDLDPYLQLLAAIDQPPQVDQVVQTKLAQSQ
jgi:hypothetical protein